MNRTSDMSGNGQCDEAASLSSDDMPDPEALQPEACYLALRTRDARFDGRFFTGVTTTGIYCRPVCRVRTPKRENCQFFRHAAQAENAGFRPCMRCRPEMAPRDVVWSMQDAGAILAQHAARLLDEPEALGGESPSVAELARRLGISDRHLRRIFEDQFGVSPLQYLQTRRLLTAKQLLSDTDLPVTQVALASGFGSVRRFNAAFAEHYGLKPTQLRREGGGEGASIQVRLPYRPPYDVMAMVRFFAERRVEGVEFVDVSQTMLGRTLAIHSRGTVHTGWFVARFVPYTDHVQLEVSPQLGPVLPHVIHRVRALLDLDADPEAINAVLHGSFPNGDGLRVPGAVSGFELAVRAVLGQQVTVAAARTFAQRIVDEFGEPIETPYRELTRLFPTPEALAKADLEVLGRMGIVRQRQGGIVHIARGVLDGSLELHGGADVSSAMSALTRLPGIGDWTAHYIAMRALRWPDAFPAGDVALQKALGVRGIPQPARAAEAASLPWKPWRSYAVVRAWQSM